MKDDKVLIALDLGSTTGFAVKSKHGLSHGTISFKVKGKFDDSGFKKLYDWLCAFEGPVELVVEKAHASRFFHSLRILFGLMAVCSLFADEHKVKLTYVSAKSIKKFWTNNGSASKDEMVAQTQQKFPSVKDDNQSDALALLYFHLESK